MCWLAFRQDPFSVLVTQQVAFSSCLIPVTPYSKCRCILACGLRFQPCEREKYSKCCRSIPYFEVFCTMTVLWLSTFDSLFLGAYMYTYALQ